MWGEGRGVLPLLRAYLKKNDTCLPTMNKMKLKRINIIVFSNCSTTTPKGKGMRHNSSPICRKEY